MKQIFEHKSCIYADIMNRIEYTITVIVKIIFPMFALSNDLAGFLVIILFINHFERLPIKNSVIGSQPHVP